MKVSPGLNIWEDWLPLQDEDHSGNDPQLFPGSLYLNSGVSPERVRSEPGLVGSKETPLAWTGSPKCDSLSYWTPGKFRCHSTFNLLWHLTNVILLISRKICVSCLVNLPHHYSCWWLPTFFISQICYFLKKEKIFESLENWINYNFLIILGKNGKVKFSKTHLLVNSVSTILVYRYFRFVPFIFREKMEGPNPSEMDIKVLIPAPTKHLPTNLRTFHNWRKKSPIGKMKRFMELKKEVWKNKNDNQTKSTHGLSCMFHQSLVHWYLSSESRRN